MMNSFIISIDNSYAMTNNFFSLLLDIPFVRASEIIVVLDGVNNANVISYCSSLSQKYDNVKIYQLDKLGYGRANNYAVKKATGKFLYFINADVFVETDCFDKMQKKLESKSIDCIQPLLIYPQTNLVQCAGTFFGPYYKAHLFEGNKVDAPVVQKEGPRQALTSALYAMKRQTFEDFGGFDEFYFNKLESFELSYKLTLGGKCCWYLPSARAWHSRGGGRGQYDFDYSQQESYFWSRFGSFIRPDISDYINMQLNANILTPPYYVIMMSQIRSWREILDETDLKISRFIEMPWISPRPFNLWDTFPYEILKYRGAIALIVESVTHLLNNKYWFRLRNNPEDIAIDRFANVVNILEYIDALP